MCSVHPSSCHQMALCQGLEQCVRYSHHFAFRWCCVVLSCTQGSEQYLQSTHHFAINIVLYCLVYRDQSSMFSPPTFLLSDSIVLYKWTGVVCSVHPSFCHHIVLFCLIHRDWSSMFSAPIVLPFDSFVSCMLCSALPPSCRHSVLCTRTRAVCSVHPSSCHQTALCRVAVCCGCVHCCTGSEQCIQFAHDFAIRQHCVML